MENELRKKEFQRAVVSVTLLLVSMFLFIVSEVMEGFAVPMDISSRKINFVCTKEIWTAIDVVRTTRGYLREFVDDSTGIDRGIRGFKSPADPLLGYSDTHDDVSLFYFQHLGASHIDTEFPAGEQPAIRVLNEDPIEWPVARAEGYVRRWKIQGNSKVFSYNHDDQTYSAADNTVVPEYLGKYCLRGWNTEGYPAASDNTIVDL